MSPDDTRHGTNAGYVAHRRANENACEPCRAAHSRVTLQWRYDEYLNRPRLVASIGTRRRVQALQCLGWSQRMIAAEVGISSQQALRVLLESDRVRVVTHERISAAYERLCMTRPEPSSASTRARLSAQSRGYAPPLAWDDIDNPDETPNFGQDGDFPYDEAVIERVLGGEWKLPTTRAERVQIIARWPGSGYELENITGWKLERYQEAS